jgi:hypothetical protein
LIGEVNDSGFTTPKVKPFNTPKLNELQNLGKDQTAIVWHTSLMPSESFEATALDKQKKRAQVLIDFVVHVPHCCPNYWFVEIEEGCGEAKEKQERVCCGCHGKRFSEGRTV